MIDSFRLAKLLRARIVSINAKRTIKLPVKTVKVYRYMIEHYFRVCFNSSIATGDAVIFPFVGNIQVVEEFSKAKGYAWDKKYNGKDYQLVIDTKRPVNIKTDESYYPKILKAALRGVPYKTEVINHSERLDEILSLLHGPEAVVGTRRRTNKITA